MAMSLIDRILTYRSLNNLSQKAFAKKCGVSASTIEHIETEPDRPIGKTTRRKIEYVLMGGNIRRKED